MKNEKGVTLVSLVITVILIIILAGVTTYSGIESYNNMKIENYVAQLRVIQEKVDLIVNEYQNWPSKTDSTTINDYLTSLGFNKLSAGETTLVTLIEEMGDTMDNYYYFSTEELKSKLNLSGFEQTDIAIAVNFGTRYVIEKEGIKVDGVEYHTQYDLPGGQKIIAETIVNAPSYDTSNTEIKNFGLTAQIKLDWTTTKDGQTSKVTNYEYKKKTDTTWKKVENSDGTNYVINISEAGEYEVRLSGITTGASKDVTITLVNPPVLADGMTAKYWDGSNWQNASIDSGTWYDYSSGAKKWANAVDSQGNWWVWIPRYAYSLDTSNKKINIKFLKEISNTTTENKALGTNETVHPAFTASSDGKYENGEWSEEITGFWINKYQVSSGGKSVPSASIVNGTTLTPTLSNTSSHLSKPSEHGAVLYLTYGEDKTYATVNTTGRAGGDATENNVYKNKTAMSSTKNCTGVYDLSTTNGELLAGKVVSTAPTNTNKLTNYLKVIPYTYIKGDAINDTSSTGDGTITNFISSTPYKVELTSMTANQFIIFGKKNGTTENMFNCISGTSAGYRGVLITK